MDSTANQKQGSQRVVRHTEYYIQSGDIIFRVRESVMSTVLTPDSKRIDRSKMHYFEYIATFLLASRHSFATSSLTRHPQENSQKALPIASLSFSRKRFKLILNAFYGCSITRGLQFSSSRFSY